MEETKDSVLIAACDCTGHGVPGGFMSMMGSLLLDKIVQSHNLETSKILKDLNSEIIAHEFFERFEYDMPDNFTIPKSIFNLMYRYTINKKTIE